MMSYSNSIVYEKPEQRRRCPRCAKRASMWITDEAGVLGLLVWELLTILTKPCYNPFQVMGGQI